MLGFFDTNRSIQNSENCECKKPDVSPLEARPINDPYVQSDDPRKIVEEMNRPRCR